MAARKQKTPSDATPKIQTGKKGRTGWKGPAMLRYLTEMRWERNAKRRMQRHLHAHPNDLQTRIAIEKTGTITPEHTHQTPKPMRVPRGTARRLRRERDGVSARYLANLEAAGSA